MSNFLRNTVFAAVLLMAIAGLALADSVTVDGTVTADRQTSIFAPIGGTVDDVLVKVGQSVKAGETLLTLRTTKVYAEADGHISGIFGEPGDTVASVASRYGAVMYLEMDSLYSASASTEYGYYDTETKTVHVGETVYLRAANNTKRTGVGRVTAVSGTKFTVEITSGEFIVGENAFVYRDADFSYKQKLGKGEISRTSPISVGTSSGTSSSSNTNATSIVSIAVKDGQQVKRGDVLMETLTGVFDGLYMSGADIVADVDGAVATLPVSQGDTITKNEVVATLYTRDNMCVTAEIPEENLKDVTAGTKVRLELSTDETKHYDGVVRMVSDVASSDTTDGVTFTAWIDFTPDEAVRFGSSMLVQTGDEE